MNNDVVQETKAIDKTLIETKFLTKQQNHFQTQTDTEK